MESHELQHVPTPQTLLSIAIEKGVDVVQLEKLMDLQERWEKKEAKKAFLTAMSLFQSKVPELKKNKKVDFATKTGGRMVYNYAELGEIDATIKDALAECGLSKKWEIADIDGQIAVSCIVSHTGGHSEVTTMKAEKDASGQMNGIQQRGSAITYLQRYTLIGALGITTASNDVDGHQEEKQPEVFDVESTKIAFGKHSGTAYNALPDDYLNWLLEKGKPEEQAKAKAVFEYRRMGQQPQAQQPTQQNKTADIPAEDYLPEAASKYGLQPEDMEQWTSVVSQCKDTTELKTLYNQEREKFDKYPPLHGLLTTRRLQIQNQSQAA